MHLKRFKLFKRYKFKTVLCAMYKVLEKIRIRNAETFQLALQDMEMSYNYLKTKYFWSGEC